MDEVTFFPILVAGIVAMAIAYLWYHPKVFGSAWMRMVGITPESVESGKNKMLLIVVVAILANMLVAYVMNYFGRAWGIFDVFGAVELGFWSWLGFVAPTMLGMVLWEHKSFKLYLINTLYWLVAFIAIAITLVLL